MKICNKYSQITENFKKMNFSFARNSSMWQYRNELAYKLLELPEYKYFLFLTGKVYFNLWILVGVKI
jgi:hypothetical protein